MNYKKFLCGISTLTTCLMLTGCGHEHTWVDASCEEPKHCTLCNEIQGEALGHTWVEASCSTPKTCSLCGLTDGETLEHTLTEANFQQAATCEICAETVGEPLTAYFEENGLVCDAQLDTAYPYTVPCNNDNDYATTGTVTFSDYEVFSSDETHEALEGYEWQAVTITYAFDDENAKKYGISMTGHGAGDYYFNNDLPFEENFTINYNGIDYTECIDERETLQSGWNDNNVCIVQYRLYERCPEGYDGWVVVAWAPTDTGEEDVLFCRLPQ